MVSQTKRYRDLLAKEKEKLTTHINSVFYSMEIILDNVDQRIKQREIAATIDKGEYETKEDKRTRSETGKDSK